MDIESSAAQTLVRLVVFVNGEQALPSESQDVAGQCASLGGIDLYELVASRSEEFDGFDGQPGKIDKGGLFIEQAN